MEFATHYWLCCVPVDVSCRWSLSAVHIAAMMLEFKPLLARISTIFSANIASQFLSKIAPTGLPAGLAHSTVLAHAVTLGMSGLDPVARTVPSL